MRQGLEAIRENLRKYGSALGAIGTAVFTGVSLTVVGDLFPTPKGKGWLVAIAAACAIGALVGIAALTGRFFRAQRRIIVKPSTIGVVDRGGDRQAEPSNGLSPDESRIVADTLREHAEEEEASSMLVLELRSMRLARVARRLESGDETAQSLGAVAAKESERLTDVEALATARASLAIVERRAHEALGHGTTALLALVIAGIVGLVFVSDYSKGQRNLIDVQKACVEAQEAGASQACRTVVGTMDDEEDRTRTEVDSLLTRVQLCVTGVDNRIAGRALSEDLREQMIAACADLEAA